MRCTFRMCKSNECKTRNEFTYSPLYSAPSLMGRVLNILIPVNGSLFNGKSVEGWKWVPMPVNRISQSFCIPEKILP